MIYTLGESLLDIIINSLDDTVVRPGGAMLNAAISLGRSGLKVSLITELGNDNTSVLISSFLKNNNVSTEFIKFYKKNSTSLALAFLDKNKKPKYTFIKNYPEIRELKNRQTFTSGDILLFGSLYSLDRKIRTSILSIVAKANSNNATIIYDPNIRNAHHLNDKNLMNAVHQNIKLSHIIKGSDEDFTNIFGNDNTLAQISEIRKINNQALIIITLGADGVIADFNGQIIRLPAFETNVESTIGAGDAFNAGIIFALSQMKFQNNQLSKIPLSSIQNIISHGLDFSARVCASLDNYIPMENTIG